MKDSTTALRENISFKWKSDLISKLKKLADKENRSLNNFLETILEKTVKLSADNREQK